MDYTQVTPPEFAALTDLDEWRYVLGGIHAHFRAGSFAAAAALATAVATAADAAEHHPDLEIRYPDRVRVFLTTHATGGLTTLDVELARTISSLAEAMGATAEPTHSQALEFAIDTLDAAAIRPFWTAVLGYRVVGENLVDPLRSGPPMWFQQLDEPRPGRGRFHIDVSVPHDEAPARVAAALAAGGQMVTDQHARSWWVLADADGNEACVCTWQDR